MLFELPLSALAAYTRRFAEPPARLAAASIAAGNTAGRFWTSSENASFASLVLWDQGNNILYIGLAPEDAGDRFSRFVASEIGGPALAAGLERFGARALDAATERRLPFLFAPLPMEERRNLFWEWPSGREPGTDHAVVPGLRWQPIGRKLLARDDLLGLDELRQEIGWMWPDAERYQQHGLGVAALHQQQLVCWCTSEYVGPEACGIGIATAAEYRGRGVATATAARFVREAVRRGLSPCWECGANNQASARVAAKVGFELRAEHRTWFGRFES